MTFHAWRWRTRRMSRRGQFHWVLLSGLLAVCLPAHARGGDADLVELRRKRIDAQFALVRLEAEESVLELESMLLAGEEPVGPRDQFPEGTRERLAAIFQR